MSYAERCEWENELRFAGWVCDAGWWVHPHVGGLHNLGSAIAILRKWVDQ